ncbi:SCF ubiquitin ligase complex subunit cdc4 [Rhizopus stolonifer]|uniref:SCF ubiquitin ligase complex subunit cdc4 n=2 Tax=Mucorineae TaxID=1344963 RepID=A0A367JTZ2_RHIST|nr:SCF ubiquitin ligase complex subunit cdc4 [Rhizopus stolonifer]
MNTQYLKRYPQETHMDNIKQILAASLTHEERMEIIRYLQNCGSLDIIGRLPIHLSARILSYSTPFELCKLRLVSRLWSKVCTHDIIWRRFCVEYKMIDNDSTVSYTDQSLYYSLFRRSMTMTKTWKTLDCKRVEMRYHTGPVLCMLIAHVTRIFTGDIDGKIHVWDTQSQKHCFIQAHKSHVSCLVDNGQMIASGSADTTIQIHHLINLTHAAQLVGHEGPVTALAYTNNYEEHILISGSIDRTIRLWDTRHGTCLRILHGQENTINSIVYCPRFSLRFCQSEQETRTVQTNKAGYIVSSSSDQSVFVWDLKTSLVNDIPEVIGSIMDTNGPVSAMAVYDEFLGEEAEEQTINEYTVARRPIHIPTFVAYAGQADTGISIFSLPGLEKTYVEAPNVHRGTIWSISAATIHSKLITTSGDRTAIMWDLKSTKRSLTLGGFDSAVVSSAVSPQEEFLCFGTEKGCIVLFDLQEFR